MVENASDRLLQLIDQKQNPCIVGLDPVLRLIPEEIKKKGKTERDTFQAVRDSFILFNKMIIDAVKEIVPAVKPQVAFYEQYGSEGMKALEETVAYAKEQGLAVIGDGKRNDIGSTAQAYAAGYLGKVPLINGTVRSAFDFDFLTVTPYLGSDGIQPFVEVCRDQGKGLFILVKTSNPSAGELQDRLTLEGEPFHEVVGRLVVQCGRDLLGERGYSSVGAVVGATYSQDSAKLRALMPRCLFLVPGYGAQGGKAVDVLPCFNEDGYGAVINASRSIIYAYQREPYRSKYSSAEFHLAAAEAALDMREELRTTLKENSRLPAW